jgi:DNA-directed RNA polymerase subunit RPC12/RpoP
MISMRSRRGGAEALVAVIAVICIAIAVAMILKHVKSAAREAMGDAYYYCENCKNEFVGSSKLIAPINCPKCGKTTAVLALKFKGKDGKAFTAYYEKYDLETKRLIEARKRGEKVDEAKMGNPLRRRPDEDWVDSMSPEGIEIRNITISPTDESKGADLVPVVPETKKK